MTDPRDPRDNPAWRAAQQWRERASQAKSGGLLDSLKMLLIWLLFGAMMIVAMVLGLFFMLLGWALMPLLRHRMKKRMESMRAEQAEDVGSGYHYRETRYRETHGGESREQRVLEGDYVVRDEDERKDKSTKPE
jgi:hypothetical protein